jgi:hypothetical protein
MLPALKTTKIEQKGYVHHNFAGVGFLLKSQFYVP